MIEFAQGIDVSIIFAAAEKDGRVGLARKHAIVDVRPAIVGEIIPTRIKGEGKETQSRPAEEGDKVVRNRSEATGNEMYLVTPETFAERYDRPLSEADENGWQPYRPLGLEMRFVIVRDEDGTFTFTAPWGEEMTARPGDALVRNPANPDDTYRVAAAAFAETYEVIEDPNS